MKNMNTEKQKSITVETLKRTDRLEEFEKIKSPEELLSFMKENIHYGFVGKNSKKIYSDKEEMDAGWGEYYLQSPEELLESKYGVCWDGAELERHWFSKNSYDHKVYFMAYDKETDLPTHTFLVYRKNDKWFWFEYSWGNQRGIHEYAGLEALLADVKKKHHESDMKNHGASREDFKCLRLNEYDKPDYGSGPEEFVAKVFRRNPYSSIN